MLIHWNSIETAEFGCSHVKFRMKEGFHCSPLRDCQVKMFWIEAWILYQPANSVHLLNIERFLDCMYIDKENLFYSCNTIKIFIQIFWIEGMILLSMFTTENERMDLLILDWSCRAEIFWNWCMVSLCMKEDIYLLSDWRFDFNMRHSVTQQKCTGCIYNHTYKHKMFSHHILIVFNYTIN